MAFAAPALARISSLSSKTALLPSNIGTITESGPQQISSGKELKFSELIGRVFASLWNNITAFFSSDRGTKLGAGIAAILLIIAVIVLIYLAVTGKFKKTGASKKKNRRSAAYDKKKKTKMSFSQRVMTVFNGINSVRTKSYNGLPRTIEKGGRCDNINWLTLKKGDNALCVNASFKQPDPVRFIIDPTNLYEFEMLPSLIKTKIRNKTGKLSISIPYKYNETPSAYVLDFENATYEDGTSAKNLFNEQFDFDHWNFKQKSLDKAPSGKSYKYTNEYRLLNTDPNYKGLDTYL